MRVLIAWAVLALFTTIASAEPAKVLVSLFNEANDQQKPDWISRAIQQSVADDLAALKSVEVVGDTSADGKAPDAQYRITGTIQRVDGELRVTGRVDDIASGKTVGGFKATGGQQDLFAIEDSISKQLKAVLAPDEKPQVANPAAPAGAQAPAVAAGGFDGSELQRALQERDYLIRAANRNLALLQAEQYNYQQPLYPYTYGLNGNSWPYNPYYYGGGGWYGGGWGGGNVVIISQSVNGRGGKFCPPISGGSGGSWGGRGSGGSWNGGGGGRPGGSWGGGRPSGSWAANPSLGLTHTMTRVPSLVMGK